MAQDFIYGGISNVSFSGDEYNLSHGVCLRSTYAHLFSPCLMAFTPAPIGKHHPAPWRAAEGGYQHDITVELTVPSRDDLPGKLKPKEVIWWIAALLRLANYPYLIVPVISDQPFSAAATSLSEPILEPFEVKNRPFSPSDPSASILNVSHLEWVREVWISGANLMAGNSKLRTAMQAFDDSAIYGHTSSSMLAVWGGLEQLFSPSTGELRFRVSTNIATYLEKAGEKRLEIYKQMLKLYNDRSIAAHTADDINDVALFKSFVIMRNALVKILDTNSVPTHYKLEQELFNPSQTESG